jgi:hypothetical protein
MKTDLCQLICEFNRSPVPLPAIRHVVHVHRIRCVKVCILAVNHLFNVPPRYGRGPVVRLLLRMYSNFDCSYYCNFVEALMIFGYFVIMASSWSCALLRTIESLGVFPSFFETDLVLLLLGIFYFSTWNPDLRLGCSKGKRCVDVVRFFFHWKEKRDIRSLTRTRIKILCMGIRYKLYVIQYQLFQRYNSELKGEIYVATVWERNLLIVFLWNSRVRCVLFYFLFFFFLFLKYLMCAKTRIRFICVRLPSVVT